MQITENISAWQLLRNPVKQRQSGILCHVMMSLLGMLTLTMIFLLWTRNWLTFGSKHHHECADILDILPILPSRLFIARSVCDLRFRDLHSKHAEYQDKLYFASSATETSSSPPSDPNRTLIVLDLDETIMDQSSFSISNPEYASSFGPRFWRKENIGDLAFSINRFEHRAVWPQTKDRLNAARIWLGVFRKYLMEFLSFTLSPSLCTNCDVILFSAARHDLLIYHAVTIEMYYNFVFDAGGDASFQFQHVIGRPENARFQMDERGKRKSLRTLMKLIGCKWKEYTKVIIVDDQASGVWNGWITPEMTEGETAIQCLEPSPFAFGRVDGAVPGMRASKIMMTQQRLIQVDDMRNGDHMIQDLVRFLKRNDPVWRSRYMVWQHAMYWNDTEAL